MDAARASEIGRIGGCGLVALAVLKRRGGVPLLRYDDDGNAIHAAVLLDGQLIHWGDSDDGLQPVTLDELRRACREDFDPSRPNVQAGEIRQVVELMGMWE